MRNKIVILVVFMMLVTSIVGVFPIKFVKAAGSTLYVGGSGAGNYSSIQSAIDAAGSDDTIFVYSGTYYENVIVDKSINLIGEDRDTTIIDGGGNGNVVIVTADGVNITGFTIQNSGSESTDVGMEIQSNYNTITGNYISNNNHGLYLSSFSHNNLIAYNNVSFNNAYGICQFHSNNNTITANDVFSNSYQGIFIQFADSGDNVISDNNITHNDLTGITINLYADNNLVVGNNIIFNGGGMWVWGTKNNLIKGNNISSNYGDGVSLSGSSDNILSNNTLKFNTAEGIDLYSSSENTFNNNNLLNNRNGLYLTYSNKNNIVCNNISDNTKYGIYFYNNGANNTISFNNISDNTQDGIYLQYDNDNNTIFRNIISNNWYALRLWRSSNNTVTENVFSETNYWAVSLSQDSINNQLYHNNFIDNINTAWDESPPNSWDNGYPSGGNFWSDYTGVDSDGDGIGDTPYNVFGGSNQDLYPLMYPWNPSNNPPIITSLNLPVAPETISEEVYLTGNFSDNDYLDTHNATINWDDGNITNGTIAGSDGIYTVAGSKTYLQAGVYTITLTVTDNNGGSDIEIFQYVVLYNPDGGFVTGGGWINSPQGAYTPNSNLTGKANFGFVSKYKKGKQTPSGNTEFNFKVADMNFHSNDYEWLVVTHHKAMYKGNGTINNAGDYGFLISAIDEDLTNSTDVDLFRIKIWDKDNNDEVIYDNMLGEEEDADPTTEIGGGNIKIHKE
jgi:parallel beta-helix repeat protein